MKPKHFTHPTLGRSAVIIVLLASVACNETSPGEVVVKVVYQDAATGSGSGGGDGEGGQGASATGGDLQLGGSQGGTTGGQAEGGSPDPDAGCDPGTDGCPCKIGDVRCGDDLVCNEETSRCESIPTSPCSPGDLNCACIASNSTCNRGDDGRWLYCGPGFTCIESDCDPGALNCGCLPDRTCDPGLACADTEAGPAVCRAVNCVQGEGGCGCRLDGACDEALVCDGVRCVPFDPQCPVGADGCPCHQNYGCGQGLFCDVPTHRCRPPQVDPGAIGAGCGVDGECNAGLACLEQTCQRPECERGAEGCGCLPNLACLSDGAIDLVCAEDNVCRRTDCFAGRIGCGCTAEGACREGGICNNSTCVPFVPPELGEEVIKEQAIDRCFLPCREGLVLPGGEYKDCPSDGLMAFDDGESCLPRTAPGPGGRVESTPTTCRSGACLTAAEGPTPCGEHDPEFDVGAGLDPDLACPAHQTCIGGECASNCGSDADCRAGRVCDKHVCRAACIAIAADCGPGAFCAVRDGVMGTCHPLSAPTGDEARSVEGAFALDVDTLSFTNTADCRSLSVTNESPRRQIFTIEKAADVSADAIPNDPNPLFWVQLGEALDAGGCGSAANRNAAERVQALDVTVGPGETREIIVSSAANPERAQWEGTLVVRNPRLGSRTVTLGYSERPEGRWVGKMYYFGQFNVNQAALTTWIANGRPVGGNNVNLGNSFLQKWQALRSGIIGQPEFEAMLQSLVTGSWRFAEVRRACEPNRRLDVLPIRACYPYVDGQNGLLPHTENFATESVPSGLVELPLALNLTIDLASDPSGRRYLGKIDSRAALQYPGNPSVSLEFSESPGQPREPGECDNVADCSVQVRVFSATSVVGARFPSADPGADCPDADPTHGEISYPWLLDGFDDVLGVRTIDGARVRTECRHKTVPDPRNSEASLNFAGANPIPDGRARVRRLEIVDGLLVDPKRLVIVFKESYPSFTGDGGSEEFSAYGVIDLRRTPALLEPGDYLGTSQVDPAGNPPSPLGAVCSDALLAENGEAPGGAVPSRAVLDRRLGLMMSGVQAPPMPADFVLPDSPAQFRDHEDPEFGVHYVCHTTGRFDDCGVAPGEILEPCPEGSGVTFILFDREALGDTDLCGAPCNRAGSCLGAAVDAGADGIEIETPWIASLGGTLNPGFRCVDGDQVLCSRDRVDLRVGKRFYRPDATAPQIFGAFLSDADAAFRYKTRFRNRDGTNLGFAPQRCVVGSQAMQYCYDPKAILALSNRMDCLLSSYVDDVTGRRVMSFETKSQVRSFLETNFSARYNANGITQDGFEKLNVELLVMLGDDAYTAAFASRFDLAGLRGGAFDGPAFEAGGITLAGPAGFEMRNLHQAVQYYQLGLDRFYRLSPLLGRALALGNDGFLGTDTVVEYVNRLVRASSQKARAWSAVAERYQGFNRPDLARRVVERAYASAYIESMALGRFLREMRRNLVNESQAAQLDVEAERAQRVYNSALLEMRDIYQSITDETTLFRLAPDYIPFPALDPSDRNAFEHILVRAREKLRVAAEKEDRALQETRAYETDRASFERELAQIKNTYEDRLAQICGTFEGSDGRIYPATKKYAGASPATRSMGDPCGLVGNGDIYRAAGNIEIERLSMERILKEAEGVNQRIEIEQGRVEEICGNVNFTTSIRVGNQNRVSSLNETIRTANRWMRRANTVRENANILAKALKCGGVDCFGSVAGSVVETAALVVQVATTEVAHGYIDEAELEKDRLQRSAIEDDAAAQCGRDANGDGVDDRGVDSPAGSIRIESAARVKELAVGLVSLGVDSLKASYQISMAASELGRLRNEATRLSNEQVESEQLAINVEAARNDPNTRIYKNDAVLNADRTFKAALVDAYKATRVYEYYTSQSYAHLNDLFIVRLATRGDISLENYLADLSDAFDTFEEQYGNPDVRVAIISLRDDVLAIPMRDESGAAMTRQQRIVAFRAALSDTKLLDDRGYLTVPFATSIQQLSPLTRDHKVLYVEATMEGPDLGDNLGRIYLRQAGTGAVRGVDDTVGYYRFPERTAVINTMSNNQKVFSPEVYRSERMRDRPFVNSNWELVLNQRDELVNQDINLNGLDDIRLFVYYTDFTEL